LPTASACGTESLADISESEKCDRLHPYNDCGEAVILYKTIDCLHVCAMAFHVHIAWSSYFSG